ncbi:unnamed protein product [Nezara viridula]|uniref:Uncharacterized protein n=1 Tax=Nezara viridula TaxID=85310 RepID=A0A9P0MSL1_NEZVI|nr:unnamed protein product [Nezara viridula]
MTPPKPVLTSCYQRRPDLRGLCISIRLSPSSCQLGAHKIIVNMRRYRFKKLVY